MTLLTTLRAGVKIADKVTKSVQEDVTHHVWTGQTVRGTPTFVDVTRKAIVEQKLGEMTRPSDATVISTQAKLTFLEEVLPNGAADRVEPFDERDEITLADGTRGPVAIVSGIRKDKPLLLEVWLGVSGQ